MAAGKERTEVHYSGQVQGVGFRYTTRRIADRFDVAGFVRNLSDGRVQLVVEGEGAEVRGFLSEVAATFAGQITAAEAENGQVTGEFSRFEIRF